MIPQKGPQGDDDDDGGASTEELSNVVYLGHIPHGFYEEEITGYFSQFGTLTQVRLSRNSKTGRSRGYAFLEFKHTEVARIVAEAMNGYLLFGNKLVCHVLKKKDVHPHTFRKLRVNRKNIVPMLEKKRRLIHNRQRTVTQHAARVRKLVERDRQRQKRIHIMGIDYEYDGFEKENHAQSKRIKSSVLVDEVIDLDDIDYETLVDTPGCPSNSINGSVVHKQQKKESQPTKAKNDTKFAMQAGTGEDIVAKSSGLEITEVDDMSAIPVPIGTSKKAAKKIKRKRKKAELQLGKKMKLNHESKGKSIEIQQ